ncbi:SDR family oxidoreductase [Planktotalea arctica]|uniref:SDR family oxidoreductase n=1 Tax=Planktotalea arctica TaxID=1481893 RepID=UPI000A16DADD|nr:SDR family oxidoreductase [Planktotalea arctica]
MKSILITGASSGIGRATAELFLSEGWRVGLVARRADMLEDIAARYDTAVACPADVTDPGAMSAAVQGFVQEAGRLDVLFNNAGMFGAQGEIDAISYADWRAVVDVNLNGMFLAAQASYAQMKAQNPKGGRIINNGSISAHSPREMSVGYTTTKHAITGLTKTLSLDGRAHDIACGQIDIGNARTEMVLDLEKRRAVEGLPALPAMDVENAARAVLHMAGLPAEANVQFMTVMASKMPFIGRG